MTHSTIVNTVSNWQVHVSIKPFLLFYNMFVIDIYVTAIGKLVKPEAQWRAFMAFPYVPFIIIIIYGPADRLVMFHQCNNYFLK